MQWMHAGLSEITSRSLLTANEQHVTLLYRSAGKLHRGGPVFDFLRSCMDESHVESVRGMRLLMDGSGAVFDVPKEYVKDFVDKCASSPMLLLELAKCMYLGTALTVYRTGNIFTRLG
jgi:hypothetical protein